MSYSLPGGPRALRRERLCKVTEVFRDRQIFRRIFFPAIPPGPVPRGRSGGGARPSGRPPRDLRPESECKVTPFPRTRQTFPRLFSPSNAFFMLSGMFYHPKTPRKPHHTIIYYSRERHAASNAPARPPTKRKKKKKKKKKKRNGAKLPKPPHQQPARNTPRKAALPL